MRGYDRTHYNGQGGPAGGGRDVGGTSGVFVGWGSNNAVANVGDVSAFAHALFSGSGSGALLQPATAALMVPTCPMYGLAAFNLSDYTGQPPGSPLGRSFGHLGATYGFQSVVSHHPALNATIAIATNIERDYQDQPSDVLCSAFNAAANLLRGQPLPTCAYTNIDYYTSTCNCTTSPRSRLTTHHHQPGHGRGQMP